MRVVLAILAALALAVGPVAAAAAQASCPIGMSDMMVKAISAAHGMHMASQEPCCSPQHMQTKKAGCAQKCAAACGFAVALNAPAFRFVAVSTHAVHAAARAGPVHPYRPPGLKRPPRSMA